MKRTLLALATILVGSTFAFATVAIQKEAKAKDASVTCKTCHSGTPFTKANLTDEGKKWVKK